MVAHGSSTPSSNPWGQKTWEKSYFDDCRRSSPIVDDRRRSATIVEATIVDDRRRSSTIVDDRGRSSTIVDDRLSFFDDRRGSSKIVHGRRRPSRSPRHGRQTRSCCSSRRSLHSRSSRSATRQVRTSRRGSYRCCKTMRYRTTWSRASRRTALPMGSAH